MKDTNNAKLEKEFKRIEKNGFKRLILLIVMLMFLVASSVATTYSYYLYRDKSGKNLNFDINGDGWPELNISLNGTNVCEKNCDTGNNRIFGYKIDGVPEYNITYGYLGEAVFNLDTNNDKIPDTNLMNKDITGDGICDLNCDVDNDGWPDTNIDLTGTGIPSYNIDTNNDGLCEVNCDINRDKIIDFNMDFNGDGIPDMLVDKNGDGTPEENLVDLDTNGDGVCDLNCDSNKDGWPDTNVDLNGDEIIDIKNIFENVDKDDISDEIKLTTNQKEYTINYLDNDKVTSTITPSWTGSKEFKVTNNSNVNLIYSIKWVNVFNDYTEDNNLYFGVTQNYNTILSLDNNRVPYKDDYMLQNIEIKPGQTHLYKVIFHFKETGVNQDVDKGKTFYAKLNIISGN